MAKKPLKAFPPLTQAEVEAAGFDWGTLREILKNPMVQLIIRQLVELLLNPDKKPPVFGKSVKHCNHKDLCLKTLQSALCAAHCAAVHYDACCAHEE